MNVHLETRWDQRQNLPVPDHFHALDADLDRSERDFRSFKEETRSNYAEIRKLLWGGMVGFFTLAMGLFADAVSRGLFH